tara:strand:- start:126 stop:932 length:807 start_codon:yes stop_codon:yes gene_type:complete
LTKIIAEIGWNHMGDMNLAKKMVESAAHNGADIVKFQTWSEKNLKPGSWDDDGRRDIYKKAELTEENHFQLKKISDQNDVQFLTSVFNLRDLEFIKNLGTDLIKIPSHEVYNLELVKQTSQIFHKILVSTGASKWSEVKEITKFVPPEKLILMHCVSSYPCPAGSVNLPRLRYLRKLSDNVGYSGHFLGIEDAMAAMVWGSTYVEKHFTIDQGLPGRDNQFSILPADLKKLSSFRDNLQLMLQDRGKDLQESELDIFENYRGRWSGGE